MKANRDGVGVYAEVHHALLLLLLFFCFVLILGRAEGLENGAEK